MLVPNTIDNIQDYINHSIWCKAIAEIGEDKAIKLVEDTLTSLWVPSVNWKGRDRPWQA